MSAIDQKRVANARRLLYWGTGILGVLLLPLLHSVEETLGLSILFETRGAVPPPDDVVIIGIDESSERALRNPVDRSLHAKLARALARAGASAVIFDLFLDSESQDDEDFAEAISEAGNVVLAASLERDEASRVDVQRLRMPTPPLAARAAGIAPWLVPEAFRIDWVFLRDDADRPTVPLVALQLYELDKLIALLRAARPDIGAGFRESRAELVRDGGLDRFMRELRQRFASDPALGPDLLARGAAKQPGLSALVEMYAGTGAFAVNRLYLNYYGPPRTLPTLPYQDVLVAASRGGELGVAGKVVFIGYSAQRQPGQRDDYPYVYSTNGFNLSGVEMGATAFENLLHGTSLKVPPLLLRVILLLLWGTTIAVCFGLFRVRPGIAIGILAMAAYLAAAIVAFRSEALWLPIAAPAVQLLFAAALSLRLKQLTERAELGIGTSEEAALALTKRGKAEKVDRRVILFADERGSKKRLRRELESLDVAERRALQRDFAIARDVPIAEHGGNINHTLADSMLAYWITPDTCDSGGVAQKVNAACRAALAIHDRVAALNQKYPGFELALRVGLDWGDVSSRLNPSPQIKDWKMEGAPIHVAERLESLNKVFGTSTLVSHAVASVLESKQFQTLELGTFVFCDDSGDVVAGPVQVHELRSAAAATSATGALAARFENALAALYRGDWAAALVRFEELASSDRGHGELASSYAGWCRQTLKETDSRWCGLVMVTFSDKSQYLDRFIGGEAVAPLR